MGKHNGKSRSSGLKVGAALANRAKKGGMTKGGNADHFKHTTDTAPAMQSVLEANDLNELMTMAELTDRDFAAERGEAVVISTGAVDAKEEARTAQDRAAAEARNSHRLRLPRRPAWSEEQSAEAVDAQERAAFVAWRRELAAVEEGEHLVLTPFEKNLEVWRQLWRVLERSHIIVQVLDARDPLRYRSEDLEAYARELHPAKASLLLLNKADLLSRPLRAAWAAYFGAAGLDHVFWSAKAASDALQADPQPGAGGKDAEEGVEDECTRVLSVDELLALLERRAAAAAAAGVEIRSLVAGGRRLMVGLTGYPNVGKSSTINALFGAKKTAVAPTPGKTKHFQTLNVTARLTLCDCPGLVLPRYAASKAEMVAAGVIPIDRLTDVRAPVAVIAQRVPRAALEAAFAMRLPQPSAHEPPDRPPTAAELLRRVAAARGWVVGNGLPDEARAGRLLLRDYTAGKLLFCDDAGGSSAEESAASSAGSGPRGTLEPLEARPSGYESDDDEPNGAGTHSAAIDAGPLPGVPAEERSAAVPACGLALAGSSRAEGLGLGFELEEGQEGAAAGGDGAHGDEAELSLADLDLLEASGRAGPQRARSKPDYKLHKKAARSKGTRGRADDQGVAYDGAAIAYGKRGGLVRVPTGR
ncbi:hypothetical protein WJX81_002790 [Elliptochloris bilobata]|uniref:G domain-containing protein n=1 Tax=Elliptochloris bilobata TaxID=381761 RepID=A0AAW1QJW6_9CHLO